MTQSKKVDPFEKLKYMGYCLSQLPPSGITTSFTDYVNYAKFQLSLDKHRLLEDPIWEKYSDEQLLVEFYANLFSKSKKALKEFEDTFVGTRSEVDDFSIWADKMIEKNQAELEKKAESLEDSVRFTPETLGES
jgi:hypothetical protein